jgi:hypothetical protein
VGGNWIYSTDKGHSSVYESAHIISSKAMSQYHDFPMPADYPDYPDHRLLKAYFQSYARHFGVEPYVQFNTDVAKAEEQPDNTWKITLGDGRVEAFDHLIVANGHHSDPRYPDYPGKFEGEYLHSHFYREPLPFKGKRVLVVGGGNSACDIVCDIARHASFTALSWRRGYYVIPKIIFGSPPDVMNAKFAWLPPFIRRKTMYWMWWLVTGGNAVHGLPAPDHDILAAHPLANSQLLYSIRHGDIHPRKDISRFEGKQVYFADGVVEDYDTVVVATGYRITFPFFDPAFINFGEGDVPLYLRVFHAEHPSLYFIGLVQPQGCMWPLADTQAQVVANRIAGSYTPPADIQERIQREISQRHDLFMTGSVRHALEIEYHPYQTALFREVPKNAPKWGDVKTPAQPQAQLTGAD